LLREAAPPGSKVILFGSYARGDAREGSDLDFLVVEPDCSDRRGEMVRLRDALRPLRLAADVVVGTGQWFDYWRETPNTLPYRASKQGRLLETVP